jgi:hypothetical protein
MVATYCEAEVYSGGSYEILLDEGEGKYGLELEIGRTLDNQGVRWSPAGFDLKQTALLPSYILQVKMLGYPTSPYQTINQYSGQSVRHCSGSL